MKELKVKVWNYKNVVIFEMLEKPDRLKYDGEFDASNGWEIYDDNLDKSSISEDYEIYIGNTAGYVASLEYGTITDAEDTVRDIEEAVAEYNESIKEILTDKEKEYLNVALYPFKESINFIKLCESCYEDDQFIMIEYDYKENISNVVSQYFERGKYFNGMELDKEYTLKDLGLE